MTAIQNNDKVTSKNRAIRMTEIGRLNFDFDEALKSLYNSSSYVN